MQCQLSFWDTDFSVFYHEWRMLLSSPHDDSDTCSASFSKDNTVCSVFLYGRALFKLVRRKSGDQLHLSAYASTLPGVPHPAFAPLERTICPPESQRPDWYVYRLSEINKQSFFAWCIKAKPALFRTLGDVSFACCNDFERCSDALSCIHPHESFYNHCLYRTNLEAGRVFYGKNKNTEGASHDGLHSS